MHVVYLLAQRDTRPIEYYCRFNWSRAEEEKQMLGTESVCDCALCTMMKGLGTGEHVRIYIHIAHNTMRLPISSSKQESTRSQNARNRHGTCFYVECCLCLLLQSTFEITRHSTLCTLFILSQFSNDDNQTNRMKSERCVAYLTCQSAFGLVLVSKNELLNKQTQDQLIQLSEENYKKIGWESGQFE